VISWANHTSKARTASGWIALIVGTIWPSGEAPHVCPGASPARLEARVAVEVFLDNVVLVTPLQPGRYDPVSMTWAHGAESSRWDWFQVPVVQP
jgi:cytochrome P450